MKRLFIDTTPLKHPAYRRLWIGQSVSMIGFQVTAVSVPVQVYALTHSSFWVGVLGIVNLVPLIVFGLWGGAVADRVDRRMLLMATSVIAWAATLVLFLQALFGLGSVPLIMICVAVQASGFAVASPTRSAIIPRLLPKDEVAAASTLNFTSFQAAILGGPLLAGILLATWGYSWAYGLDAVLFTAGLWAAFRLPPVPPLVEEEKGAPGFKAVAEGLRYLWTTPILLLGLVVDIIAMAVAMPRALFPELAETRFGGGAAVGWLFAAIGIGAFAGGLFSGWVGRVRRQGVALIVSIVVWGLAVAAAGLMHNLWAAVALLAIGGAADLVSAVYRQTMMLNFAPDELRGRLGGVFFVSAAGGPRLGDLRAGAMAVAFGAGTSWVFGGVACAVLVVIVGLMAPSLWRYTVGKEKAASVTE